MTVETPTAPPLEVVTPIKPSEAIRLGCLIAPVQGFGRMVLRDGSACALGAALLAIGRPPEQGVPHGLFGKRVSDRCPASRMGYSSCDHPSPVRIRVEHLNDAHHWTRERIADWLESLGL